MALEKIDTNQGMPVITLIIGYAVGNGIQARKGATVDPIIGPRNDG